MALDGKLERQLHRLLSVPNDSGAKTARLMEDGLRLWQRITHFAKMNLIRPDADLAAMELACYALQLPLRHSKNLAAGRLGQISLRERSEQSAELALGALGDHVDEDLLERVASLLRELPHRSPPSEEARLLADAVNLDDFGVTGLVLQAMQLSRQQASVTQVAEGFEKRLQYGYWAARLKDGFHFEPIRQIARERLRTATHVVDLLVAELKEDQAP